MVRSSTAPSAPASRTTWPCSPAAVRAHPPDRSPGWSPSSRGTWDTLDRKLLVLDYNLLGARSFEDAIFGGYIATVARLHPEAPAPVLHTSDAVLDDARKERGIRRRALLPATRCRGDTSWWRPRRRLDAETFEAAAAEAPGHPDRDRLVGDLLAKVFTGYARAGEWLPMADGLKALANHAKLLGYQGLVFLIDEGRALAWPAPQ